MQVGRRATPHPAGPGTFETPNKAELLKVDLGHREAHCKTKERVKAGELAVVARTGPT